MAKYMSTKKIMPKNSSSVDWQYAWEENSKMLDMRMLNQLLGRISLDCGDITLILVPLKEKSRDNINKLN